MERDASKPIKPAIVTLVDVAQRELTTFTGEELAKVRESLETYDVIGAINVRAVLRGLDFEPGGRRLAELGPPQKSRQLNKRGRTLKITADLLVQGSCGISKPFGEPGKLKAYLDRQDWTRLQRRIESDAKSLYALYQYGRLHRAVRLRWGFLDELILAPWVYEDESWLSHLIRVAMDHDLELEVVAGSAPGWSEPWARAVRCMVEPISDYSGVLVTDDGRVIDDRDVQLARVRSSELM